MIISSIKLDQVRAYDKATFNFLPGMNIIVGDNGAGKSTLLDSIRNGLHKIMPELTAYRSTQNVNFDKDDIQFGKSFLAMEFHASYQDYPFSLLMDKHRDRIRTVDKGTIHEKEHQTPDTVTFVPDLDKIKSVSKPDAPAPICLYFPVRRAYTVDQKPQVADTGQAAAYSLSLSENRDFNIREIADWIRVQQFLQKEDLGIARRLIVVQTAINRMMSEIGNVYVSNDEDGNRLMVMKNEVPLYAKRLSDGEKSMLAFAVEISRRLAIANPHLMDPIADGTGIVLIDELDLHLHPNWQRYVVKQLTETFPKLQFIATTHSPQIVGEVTADRVHIIDDVIHQPENTFGVGSGRIVEEVMGGQKRNTDVKEIMSVLFQEIDDEDLVAAKETLEKLKEMVGDTNGVVLRAESMISFLED